MTITHSKTGEQLYHNAFVTHHSLTDQTVVEIVKAGRARWKSENENNNVLKTKGYKLIALRVIWDITSATANSTWPAFC